MCPFIHLRIKCLLEGKVAFMVMTHDKKARGVDAISEYVKDYSDFCDLG